MQSVNSAQFLNIIYLLFLSPAVAPALSLSSNSCSFLHKTVGITSRYVLTFIRIEIHEKFAVAFLAV